MSWSQRLRNGVFARKPSAKINELATARTERSELSINPVTRLPASWTLGLQLPDGFASGFEFADGRLHLIRHGYSVSIFYPSALQD